MRRLWMVGSVLSLAFGIVACDGDPDPDPDSGTPEVDSGPVVTNPPPIGIGAMRTTLTAANLECRGTRSAPAAGAASSFNLFARDFFPPNMFVEGLTIHFFPDNVVEVDCSGSCIEVTSDAAGLAEVTGSEGGWYAYRIEAGTATHNSIPEEYVAAVQYNEVTPAAAGMGTMNAVRQSTVNTLTSLLLINQQPGTAIVTGTITDCDEESIANARVRIFDSSGEIVLGTDRNGPKSFYFNGDAFPNANERETNVDGLYGAGNIPIPANGQIRVELWGVITEGGEPEMLGCEEVGAVADGLTIINVGPTRSDGPSGCSGS